jgi:hypothetical protein
LEIAVFTDRKYIPTAANSVSENCKFGIAAAETARARIDFILAKGIRINKVGHSSSDRSGFTTTHTKHKLSSNVGSMIVTTIK